jgi:hypothetical protein
MISNLQKAGSSQKYVASLLNAVENYILQNMEETKQNLIIELLHDLENFAKANTKGQLQDILPNFYSMVYKFMNRNYGRHPLLFGSLKKFLGENQYHMKKRVNEEIFGWINELKPTLDVSASGTPAGFDHYPSRH